MSHLPLKGLVVLEFSQYLSGPSAGLRLADLGARVIKIERPTGGDACRSLSIKNLWIEENSLLFHTINRNKESFTADLKNPDDLELLKQLIRKADVITHNFRPGVMERIGLDYDVVKEINPRVIYAEISGYGKTGPWADRPGQDLLLQAVSGLVFTTGNAEDAPTPFGLSIADSLCGAQLVQGVLAALIRRHKAGKGAHIELSLLESLLDFQFELLTTYYNSGQLPERSTISNGQPLLSAPYGIYPTKDGFIAIAMTPLQQLADVLNCAQLRRYTQDEAFAKRDEIKQELLEFLAQETTNHWLGMLKKHDIWAIEVMDWRQLVEHEGYKVLGMSQEIRTASGKTVTTSRCPIRLNGKRLYSDRPAPMLGEHTDAIIRELKLFIKENQLQG